MTIGYVTLEEANQYIETHYLETEEARTMWEDLDDDSKEILLRRSHEAIDCLPFPGRKTYPDKPESFPRYPKTEVPYQIKHAQIENALSLSDTSISAEKDFYDKMRSFGISSYSIGNLSESFGSATVGASGIKEQLGSVGVLSSRAQMLIAPFLYGGFRI